MIDHNRSEGSEPIVIDRETGPSTADTQFNGLPSYQSLLDGCETMQPSTLITSGVLIFPSEPPANALYQLSRDLVAGTRVSISRIDRDIHTSSNNTPITRVRDTLIYTVSHQIFDDSSIEIIGKRRDGFPLLLMSRTLRFREERWLVSGSGVAKHAQSLILRCGHTTMRLPGRSNPYRWYDAHDRLIAIEDHLPLKDTFQKQSITSTSLRIVVPLDQKLIDVLVVSWCARVWNHNLKATGQIRSISKGKNASFKEAS